MTKIYRQFDHSTGDCRTVDRTVKEAVRANVTLEKLPDMFAVLVDRLVQTGAVDQETLWEITGEYGEITEESL